MAFIQACLRQVEQRQIYGGKRYGFMVKKEKAGTRYAEFEWPVERGKIREFAGAIMDPNPVYRDRDYAQSKGFDDVLIPVTFPMSFVHHMDSENFILEMTQSIGMETARSVHGEFEVSYERPICAGETLRGEMDIGKIYEKEGGRGGKMTFVEVEIKFFDHEDKLVARIRNLHIERGK